MKKQNSPTKAPSPVPSQVPSQLPTTQAFASCAEMHAAFPGTTSGYQELVLSSGEKLTAYCSDGWTLAYSRNNAYWTPDHMYHRPVGATLDPADFQHSVSWFIPSDAAQMKWQVSVDAGYSWRHVTTSIPSQARATVHATALDIGLTMYDSTLGTSSSTFFYNTFTYADRAMRGCSSGGGTWFGVVTCGSGAADQANPGIGAHCDSCSMATYAATEDLYTFGTGYPGSPDVFYAGSGDLEYYISDFKNVQGSGLGGTNCAPDQRTTDYRYRFWAK